MMWWKRIVTVSLAAGLFVSVVASVAAAEDHLIYEDGTYHLVIPGVGDFWFEVDYVEPEGDEMVIAVAALPKDYYYVDDDDPAKAAWKAASLEVEMNLEVEMKLGKIESKVNWGTDGVATLTLPGGSITVTEPVAGDFTVMASGIWTEFGSGGDWMVANNPVFGEADRFFKVEATPDGIEIKAVSRPLPGDGFLNDLNEEYEEEEEEEEAEEVESEDDDSEGAGHGKEKNQGKGKNN